MSVVVPGKFAVFARRPQRWLNSVVLPVFGLPTRAIRGRAPRHPGAGPPPPWRLEQGGDGQRQAHGHGALRDDEDAAGDGVGDADARRAHLHDPRIPGLAHPQAAGVGQPERLEQLEVGALERGAVEARLGADAAGWSGRRARRRRRWQRGSRARGARAFSRIATRANP
jgi:hypothetical protein